MRQLSFGLENGVQRSTPRISFRRLGTVLLASLALSCWESDTAKKTSEPAKQSIVGTYTCTSLDNKTGTFGYYSSAGTKSKFSIYEKNGNFFLTDEASDMLKQLGVSVGDIPVTADANGFHFESKSPKGVIKSVGLFSSDGTIAYSRTQVADNSSTTFRFRCTKCEAKNETELKDMKAVFIRPCESQLFADTGFDSKPPKTAVGGGTVDSVCADLRKSGVTDVFISFKVDHEGKGCGTYGQLLYDSKIYDAYESPCLKEAFSRGLDPIGYFMKKCKSEYSNARKSVRIHAWFPVFADRYAAKLAGQPGYSDKGLLGNIWAFLSGLFEPVKPDCKSNLFADPSNSKVVEYELALLEEIKKKYPALSGINLDYVRYDDPGSTCSNGYKVSSWLVNAAALDDFVKKVKANSPDFILSADVRASMAARQGVGQDGILNLLDFVVPMAYTPTWVLVTAVGPGIEEIRWAHPDLKIVPALRGWKIKESSDKLLIDLRIDLQSTKDAKANGYAIFTYESLLSESNSMSLASIKEKIGY